MREDDIQEAVVDHWRKLGVKGSLVAAIPNKKAFGQAGLTPGLPDLLVISPTLGSTTGFIELKTAKGVLSDAQREISMILMARGIPYVVARGRDEPIRILEAWGAVKPSRPQ